MKRLVVVIGMLLLTRGAWAQPTLSACGEGSTVMGNDLSGTVSVKGRSVSTCALAFVDAFADVPTCSAYIDPEPTDGTVLELTDVSEHGFTITANTPLDDRDVRFDCK